MSVHFFPSNSRQMKTDLEFVAYTDEAQFAGLLLGVFGVVGVLEELSDEFILRLAHQTRQGRVKSVVILLYKLSLKERAEHRTKI